MSDPKKPKIGDMHIDASDVVVKDVTPEDIKKYTKVRDGWQDAALNVVQMKDGDAERAGISPQTRSELAALVQQDARITEVLMPAQKMAELLHESRQRTRHEIGVLLGEAAAQATRRADRVPNKGEVLGPLAPLLDYQYGPAKKGAATRQKGKDEKDGE
jgi:hypothetical protein